MHAGRFRTALAGVVAAAALAPGCGVSPAMDPADPRMSTGSDGVVLLAADWCGYCRRQRRDFEAGGVLFRILDVDTVDGARALRALGTRTVPVTVIGQTVVRGYDTDALHAALEPLGTRIYRRSHPSSPTRQDP